LVFVGFLVIVGFSLSSFAGTATAAQVERFRAEAENDACSR
jgi:hypothetical protein